MIINIISNKTVDSTPFWKKKLQLFFWARVFMFSVLDFYQLKMDIAPGDNNLLSYNTPEVKYSE